MAEGKDFSNVGSNYDRRGFNRSIPGAYRSLSDSGHTPLVKDDLSRSLKSTSNKLITDFVPQNEHRREAFKEICSQLESLQNGPLSEGDWDAFEDWCTSYDEYSNTTTLSSTRQKVYKSCRLIMIDLYGGLPEGKDWIASKEWFSAICPAPESVKAVPVDNDDKKDDFKPQTREEYGEQSFYESCHQPSSERKCDPKGETRMEVDTLKHGLEHTDTKVAALENLCAQLQKNVGELQREKRDLSRSRQSDPYPKDYSKLQEAEHQNRRLQQDLAKKESDMEAVEKKRCELEGHANQQREEIASLQKIANDFAQRVNRVEAECVQLQQSKERSHLEQILHEKHYYESKLKNRISDQAAYIKQLEEEKSEALRRLSTLASAKLSDNNPNITDLSDLNRPQKIGDKYSELYDNEWTDAYEYLNTTYQNDQKSIAVLLSTLEDCFRFCKDIGRRQYEQLLHVACTPPPVDDQTEFLHGATGQQHKTSGKEIITQKVVALRKASYQQSITAVKQAYKTGTLKDTSVIQSTNPDVATYVDKCLEISWLACIQDPPLDIICDFPPYSKVDFNIVRKYTKSGEYVEYVVWPALLLSDGGALLSKGVVQCTSRHKADNPAIYVDGSDYQDQIV